MMIKIQTWVGIGTRVPIPIGNDATITPLGPTRLASRQYSSVLAALPAKPSGPVIETVTDPNILIINIFISVS